MAYFRGRKKEYASLVAVTPVFERAIDFDEFWQPGLVTVEGLEVLDVLGDFVLVEELEGASLGESPALSDGVGMETK